MVRSTQAVILSKSHPLIFIGILVKYRSVILTRILVKSQSARFIRIMFCCVYVCCQDLFVSKCGKSVSKILKKYTSVSIRLRNHLYAIEFFFLAILAVMET